MTEVSWDAVRDLFHRARGLSPEEREELLASLGEGSPLAVEVRELLEHDAAEDTFLREPLVDPRSGLGAMAESLEAGAGGSKVEPLPEIQPGQRLGAWEVVRLLGRGGMGAVYLGRRADGAYRADVALKVLRPGLAGPEVERRFLLERQILADLDHPSIARLLDGGTLGDGRPYLVMEYVEGEPLDQYCDRHRLSVEQRLGLFQEACRVVHFAHQNLVVHRDLKPGNILVAADGRLKLLDFGIAKLLEPYGGASAGQETGTALAPMTPEFASPEQMRGQPITTACDVYALGALLYLLLSGRRPFNLSELSPQEFVQAVCERQPTLPSRVIEAEAAAGAGKNLEELAAARRTEPRRLQRHLAGDLDRIVAKALRKDPRERYLSAQELALDVERHLTGRPVQARDPSFGYRLRKFLQRYRWPVAAVAAVVLALTALATGLYFKQQALLREQAQSREVTGFLEGLFEVSDPDQGRGEEVTARELLDRGTLDIRSRLEEQPQLRARLLATMGRVYRKLGLYEDAGPLLEDSLELRRRILGPRHPEVAQSLVDLGDQAVDLGAYDDAVRSFEEAREALEAKGRLQTEDGVRTLAGLAAAHRLGGDFDRAATLAEEAVELAGEVAGPDHDLTAATYVQLGAVRRERGEVPQAEEAYTQAQEIFRRRYGEQHPRVASLYNSLGLLYDESGDFGAAEASFRQALATHLDVFEEHHPEVAATRHNLAALLDHQGRFAEAEELAREVLESRRRSFGERHPLVADALNLLGVILLHRGEPGPAEEALRQALELWSDLQGEDFVRVAAARSNLGQVLQEKGELDAAEEELGEALRLYRQAFGDDHLQVATVHNNLAVLHRRRGDLEAARRGYEEGLRILRLHWGQTHPSVATLSHNLAVVLEQLGDLDAAEASFRQALDALTATLPEGHLTLGIVRKNLAGVLVRRQEHEAAAKLLANALAIFRDQGLAEDEEVVLAARGLLGETRLAAGDRARAEALLRSALDDATARHGPDSAAAQKARERVELLDRRESTQKPPSAPPAEAGRGTRGIGSLRSAGQRQKAGWQ